MSSITRSECWQATTLWFVVVIFFQTSTGATGPLSAITAFIALPLLLVIPVYLIARIGVTLTE